VKVRFVAEVSSNHERSLARAVAFVEAAARVGCAAVKFQQFRVRELFASAVLSHRPALLARSAWEFPESFHEPLAACARTLGIAYACTPFYLRAVGLLEPWVDFYKVASYQILWTDLLREVGRTGKPVVLATGMATLDEVRGAVAVLREAGTNELELLHCVSAYPTPPAEANLAAIGTLRAEFGLPVGWSDHTASEDVIVRAVRQHGASMIEFHLDLDGQGAEYGGGHCWLPGDIGHAILASSGTGELPVFCLADGDGLKVPRACELLEREWRTEPSDGLRPLLATRAKVST
jgi:sialic acid synthase SpsE